MRDVFTATKSLFDLGEVKMRRLESPNSNYSFRSCELSYLNKPKASLGRVVFLATAIRRRASQVKIMPSLTTDETK
jgi:hypothetical protein